jgi:hypothetical protein
LGSVPPAIDLLSKSNNCAVFLPMHGRFWVNASKAAGE